MPFVQLLLLAVAHLLAGCASSGALGSAALSAPPPANTGRLVVFRSAFAGFALQPEYTISGAVIGTSQAKGFVMCDLKPGKYELATPNPELNVNLGGGTTKQTVEIQAGKTAYFEASPSLGLLVGVITLAPADEQRGRAETNVLNQTTSTCPSV